MAPPLVQTLTAASAASAASVLASPGLYDTFTLDGDTSPGKSEITSGGNAHEKIEDQAQLLTKGANTVVRGSANAVITYKLTLWSEADLAKWRKWEAMFLEGRSRTPNPRVYLISDLRVSWVQRVIFEDMSPQGTDKPGGPWSRTIILHQWNRVKPYGGPIRVQSVDKEIVAQQAATDASKSRLAAGKAAAEAARRAGK